MEALRVEVTRGDRCESVHAVAASVVDRAGRCVFEAGDMATPRYPRSAIKAMLAVPLVESGIADRLGLDDAALALVCASHAGEPVHVASVRRMLACCGRDVAALGCGIHPPLSRRAAAALVRAGEAPCALHNNCSGKHAGLVCLAVGMGLDPVGYESAAHGAMRAATASLAGFTATACDDGNRAVDGCGIPTYAIPLAALAQGFAVFGTADGAAARLRRAVAAHPVLVAGEGRFDTVLTARFGERVFVKGGAEGVWCAALPALGLGMAVKAEDGAGRAGEAAIATLLERFLGEDAVLAERARPVLRNWAGEAVGGIRVSGAPKS